MTRLFFISCAGNSEQTFKHLEAGFTWEISSPTYFILAMVSGQGRNYCFLSDMIWEREGLPLCLPPERGDGGQWCLKSLALFRNFFNTPKDNKGASQNKDVNSKSIIPTLPENLKLIIMTETVREQLFRI